MKIGIITFLLCIGILALPLFIRSACATYEKQCFISPIPTQEIVSPTISLAPSISLTCTPTPEISISPSIESSTPTEIVPTDTPTTQIGSSASANNNSPSAGSSANIVIPTGAPMTGRAEL